MSVTCVVQARMRSSRLPGKALADLGGEPMLAVLLRRLATLEARLVVATGSDPGDDPIERVAGAAGAEVVRGPEQDVLARFCLALERHPAAAVVRITSDCPLLDAALVGEAIELWESSGADYVSNTLVRTFPDGLDIEVISAEALRAADAQATDPVEREHVTPFVYRRPERFRLRTLRRTPYLGHLRWTVDTPEDLSRVRRIVGGVGALDFGWEDALGTVDVPRPAVAGRSFLPAEAGDSGFLLELRNEGESVRWSRSRRRVEPAEHERWLASVLEDPGTRLWVARERERRVGQARIDVRGGVGTVSVGVEPGSRGAGVGSWILEQLETALAADEQVCTLIAEVNRENDVSRRLFASAGFAEAGGDGGFVFMSRRR